MRRAILLGIAGFVLVLIVRLPARWVRPLLPRTVHCEQLDGSAWHGSCAGLSLASGPLGDASWELHALQLLRGRLALTLDLTHQANFLRGELAFGFGGAVHGRDLTLDLPLNSTLLSSMPAGAHARLSGRFARLEWSGKFVSDLQGELDVQDLTASDGEPFGNYQALFAPAPGDNDGPRALVHDSGGPLQLQATLQLTRDPGYVLQGRVTPRPSASAGLAEDLKYLGTPDASGSRPFSLQGTF